MIKMVQSGRVKRAFRHIKDDIMLLKAEVARLSKENEMLINIVKEQTDLIVEKKKVVKTKNGVGKTTFVASKNGGKFHKSNCPYAKNIKPKDKISFKSKNAFLNKNYKPCKCVV